MELALRYVQVVVELVSMHALPTTSIGEELRVRLASSHVLGGNRIVEWVFQGLGEVTECPVIGVGHGHETVVLLKALQRLDGIGERRPVRNRGTKRFDFGGASR